MEKKKYILEPDPMHNLDEEDSKALLEYMKTHVGEPTKYKHLNNAKVIGNKVYFDLEIKKIKKSEPK